MKTVRIVGGNEVYGYKGTLYRREDNLGKVIDHEVEDAVAEVLLNDENTPWREVVDGEVVPNEADSFGQADADDDLASRTINVDNSTIDPKSPEGIVGGLGQQRTGGEAPKTLNVEDLDPADDDKAPADEPAAETKKTKLSIGGKAAAPGDTDGAVEV